MKLKTEKNWANQSLLLWIDFFLNDKNQRRKKWENIWSISEIKARRDITADTTDIKEIIKNIKRNSYAHKFDYLHEMDTFPKNKNLPKYLRQKETTQRDLLKKLNMCSKLCSSKSSSRTTWCQLVNSTKYLNQKQCHFYLISLRTFKMWECFLNHFISSKLPS